MPKITHIIRVDIDLSQQPVQELCDVIAAVLPAYRGMEKEILSKLREAIDGHLEVLKKEDEQRGANRIAAADRKD
jgi:hypothetical protein